MPQPANTTRTRCGFIIFKLKCLSYAALITLTGVAAAQNAQTSPDPSTSVETPMAGSVAADLPLRINFSQYLQLVRANNLTIAAQKAQIDIADALIALAALFPDPSITTGLASYEMTKNKLPTISNLGVNFTIEGGRKRAARTEAAQADKARVQADLVRLEATVQLEATNAYIDQLRARSLQQSWRAAQLILEKLEQHSQKQPEKPDILSLVQLRTETLRAQAELDAATAEVYISSRTMMGFVQSETTDLKRLFEGRGSLEMPAIEGPQTKAQEGFREDVLASEKAVNAARKREELSIENRSMDMNFTVGVNHARAGDYLGTSLPQSNGLTALLTLPIPFSLRQDGDLRAASAATTQALKQYQDVLHRSSLEGEQARARYGVALSQMQKYSASAEFTANALASQATLYFAKKAELNDVIVLFKLSNESNSLRVEAQANHARTMAILLSQARDLPAMPFERN